VKTTVFDTFFLQPILEEKNPVLKALSKLIGVLLNERQNGKSM